MKLTRNLLALLFLGVVLAPGLAAQTSSSVTQHVTFGVIRSATVMLANVQKSLVRQDEIDVKSVGIPKVTVGNGGADEMNIESMGREVGLGLAIASSMIDHQRYQRIVSRKDLPIADSQSDGKKVSGKLTITLTD